MPSTGQAVARAWRDLANVFAALAPLVLIALAIMLAIALGTALLSAGPGADIGTVPFALVSQFLHAFLLTPYLIAVHRFIILGEVSRDYWAALSEPRFRPFFGWSLVLSLIWSASIWLSVLLTPLLGTFLSVYLVALVPLVVLLRVIVLFPAVAVDAPGATWRNALADTRGHAWRIFWILLVAALPLLFADMVAVSVLIVPQFVPGGAPQSLRWTLTNAAVGGVSELFFSTLAVVIASRLYEWIGDRVKQRD